MASSINKKKTRKDGGELTHRKGEAGLERYLVCSRLHLSNFFLTARGHWEEGGGEGSEFASILHDVYLKNIQIENDVKQEQAYQHSQLESISNP